MAKEKSGERFFTARLPVDLYAKLEKLAEQEQSSMGRLVRLAVEDYLRRIK
jgi:predicted transcriptional regulator